MSQPFNRSSKAQPCPVCARDHDDDCRWDDEKFLCHTNIERTEVAGYGYRGKTKDGLWGIYVKDEAWIKPPRPTGCKNFIYLSRDGKPLARVTRKDSEKGRQFYQSHWTQEGYVKGVPDSIKSQVPIYRYLEVRDAIAKGQPVFMVEGEGCADALWSIGIAATTTLGGSKKYRSYGNYLDDLKGAELVLCPDRDKVGVEHMEEIAKDFPEAQWCYPLPYSKTWQNLPDSGGYDIADWISEGAAVDDIFNAVTARRKPEHPPLEPSKKELSDDDLIQRVIEIRRLGDGVKQWFAWSRLAKISGYHQRELERLALAIESRHEFKPVDGLNFLANTPDSFPYLIDSMIVLGINMLVYADSGVGKSLLFYHVVKAIATGLSWSGFDVEQGRALIIQTDEPSVVTKRRLKRMGFDQTAPGLWYIEQNWQFSQMAQLEQWIREYRPKIVLIDCLTTSNRNAVQEENEVGYSLVQTDLMKLADHYQCSIITLHHENKMGDMRGSSGLRAHVSEVWQLRKPSADECNMATLGENHRVLDIKKTRTELIGKHVLQFFPDNYEWLYLGNLSDLCSGEGERKEKTSRPAILHYLKEQSGNNAWYSAQMVVEAVSKSLRTVQRELTRLHDQGLIEQTMEPSTEKGGRATPLYRFIPPPKENVSLTDGTPQRAVSEFATSSIFDVVNCQNDQKNEQSVVNPTDQENDDLASENHLKGLRQNSQKIDTNGGLRHDEMTDVANLKPRQGAVPSVNDIDPLGGGHSSINDDDLEDLPDES